MMFFGQTSSSKRGAWLLAERLALLAADLALLDNHIGSENFQGENMMDEE